MHARPAYALYGWAAGLLVSLTPILCHLTISAGSGAGHGANWTVDLLFVAITTSGLSMVNLVTRLAGGILRPEDIQPHGSFLVILNAVTFLLAGVLFGWVSTQPASPHGLLLPLLFLVFAVVGSLYFEISQNRALEAAGRDPVPPAEG
jgi:hypothetical protein